MFPCLTLLGYDTKEEPLKRLQQLGYKVGDEDSRYEGVEIKQSSPFKLMRSLAKEYGYRPLKAVNSAAPGMVSTLLLETMTGYSRWEDLPHVDIDGGERRGGLGGHRNRGGCEKRK